MNEQKIKMKVEIVRGCERDYVDWIEFTIIIDFFLFGFSNNMTRNML